MDTTPSFRFASRRTCLTGYGSRLTLRTPPRDGLLADASAVLGGLGPDDRLVGALPFAHDAPAALFVPERIDIDLRPVRRPRARATVEMPVTIDVCAEPQPFGYCQMVQAALDRFRAARTDDEAALRKVVLARTLLATFEDPIDPGTVFEALCDDPASTVYQTAFTRADGHAAHFIGASPELLVDRQGDVVRSMPMAGSTPRAATTAADRERAARLLASEKDRREHRLVVESVLDALAPFCHQLDAPSTPELASTATMWHLATPVIGRLRGDHSSLELALALHPTPAVCGTPCAVAREAIAALEPFDRGLFTGAVGWTDGRGDGCWMVSIRCAEICGAQARLYAGAGIVAGSDPVAEANETGAKFGALLNALGMPSSPLPAVRPGASPDRVRLHA
ncbi:MAG: hypothetical protein ABS36_09545 [Acidobacteria bacterium SCN 69-37]|nr:MAG: hypothetical protein ABS36_09545 [Acidobacteria bacterium SCN 69-37]